MSLWRTVWRRNNRTSSILSLFISSEIISSFGLLSPSIISIRPGSHTICLECYASCARTRSRSNSRCHRLTGLPRSMSLPARANGNTVIIFRCEIRYTLLLYAGWIFHRAVCFIRPSLVAKSGWRFSKRRTGDSLHSNSRGPKEPSFTIFQTPQTEVSRNLKLE
jgi:hypothetical protein